MLLTAAAFCAYAAEAQPLRDRVIDDAVVTGRCLTVSFNFPLQYVRHFPDARGSSLQIAFDPGATAERIDGDALLRREVVRPTGGEALHISDVAYEGDAAGGPYLVVDFDRDVDFRVAQGADFRSFVIAVLDNNTVPSCFSGR